MKGIVLLTVGMYPLSMSVISFAGGDGATVLNLLLLLIGVGTTLIALRSLKSGQRIEPEPSASEGYMQMVVLRRVYNELQDGPKSIEELVTSLDHTESRIDEAITYLHRRDMVDENDGDYKLSSGARTFTGRMRFRLRAFISNTI